MSQNHTPLVLVTSSRTKANELIDISPGYDLTTYYCIAMRNNLFRRIKDDRGGTNNTKRLGAGYLNPYNSIPAMILYTVGGMHLFWSPTATGVAINSRKASSFWLLVQSLIPINQIHSLAYWSSTVYGGMYRHRITLPLIIGLLLFQRSLLLHNPGLRELVGTGFDIGIMYDVRIRLLFVNFGFVIKYGLYLYSLHRSCPRDLKAFYFDDRFDVEGEWTTHGREFFPGEREREAAESTGGHLTSEQAQQARGQVRVRVKSVCARPLPGERTKQVAFWPQDSQEVLLLLAAAVIFLLN